MKRIAVICTAISPYLGSEYSVAWNFVKSMSKNNMLYVIYGNAGNGFGDFESIREWQKQNDNPNIKFVEVHLPDNKFYKTLEHYSKKYDKSLVNIGQIVREKNWHKYARLAIEELYDNNKIDLIHYLNPIGFKEPGYAWNIKGIPYCWGPISGAHRRSWQLRKCLSTMSQIKTFTLRNILHYYSFKYNQRVKKAIKRCDYILGATPTTIQQIKNFHKRDAIYMPENGIMRMEVTTPVSYNSGDTFEIVWIGRVDENKALILLLEALNKIKDCKWHLNVVGDGLLYNDMNKFCDNNNINHKITWFGKVGRDQVMSIIKQSHLHVITSLGEATTTVLFEAMSFAVPTLSLDHCGMAGVICDNCGIKIPIHSYDQVTNDISHSIKQLIDNPHQINKLSSGVLECSKQYMYEERIKLFEKIYEEAIQKYNTLNNENNTSK